MHAPTSIHQKGSSFPVRDAKKCVKDEALLREISAFIGQEAMHGKEHLEAVGGTYAQRAIAMTIVSIGIGPMVLAAMLSCMKQDSELSNIKSWLKFTDLYFARKGIFRKMIPDLAKFYKLGFHPMQANVEAPMKIWKERLKLA